MSVFGTKNTCGNIHLLSKKAKQPRKPSAAVKVPDETILAMRRLYELESHSYAEVHALFPQFSILYIRAILGYQYRAHLRVKP